MSIKSDAEAAPSMASTALFYNRVFNLGVTYFGFSAIVAHSSWHT